MNGCKSCLVHPPCNGKVIHATNGLVMLPDPAECVEQSGSITTISTPDILDAVFTIPSPPTNLPMNEQQTLTLHRVRSDLQDVPTLEVTPQLIEEMADKIQTQYKKGLQQKISFSALLAEDPIRIGWPICFYFMDAGTLNFSCLDSKELLRE